MTMNVQSPAPGSRSARPFGSGLRDPDLRLMVASTDVRYRQKLKAVIVRRSAHDALSEGLFVTELIVLNTPENIAVLRAEAHKLDPSGRLVELNGGDIADVILVSNETQERVMITSLGEMDFKRIEQIASLEQIHIGDNDRGSWVCRLIEADLLDALFSGRMIDVRNN